MCPETGLASKVSGSQIDFNGAVDAYRQALHAYMTGDPKPALEFFSWRDDVTLANPLGSLHRGPAEVAQAAEEGAAQVSEGTVRASRRCLDTAPLTSATSSRSSGPRRGWPVAGT
jgi:hypothetical protein